VQLNRRAALALATCGLTYWLVFGGTFGGALSPLQQTIGHVFVFLIMAGAGWKLWRRDSSTECRSLRLSLSFLIGLILVEVAARTFLQRSWNSAEDFALCISGFVVFMLLLNWFRVEGDLVIVCVWAAVTCTLLGIALAHWRGDGTLALPLGNRVLMAGLLTLTTPLAIGGFRTCQGGGLAGKLLWLSAALILVVGILETRSAVAIALLPFGVVLVLVAGEKRLLRVAAALVLAITILCGALTSLVSVPSLVSVRSFATVLIPHKVGKTASAIGVALFLRLERNLWSAGGRDRWASHILRSAFNARDMRPRVKW